jgi:hypothetical protein
LWLQKHLNCTVFYTTVLRQHLVLNVATHAGPLHLLQPSPHRLPRCGQLLLQKAPLPLPHCDQALLLAGIGRLFLRLHRAQNLSGLPVACGSALKQLNIDCAPTEVYTIWIHCAGHDSSKPAGLYATAGTPLPRTVGWQFGPDVPGQLIGCALLRLPAQPSPNINMPKLNTVACAGRMTSHIWVTFVKPASSKLLSCGQAPPAWTADCPAAIAVGCEAAGRPNSCGTTSGAVSPVLVLAMNMLTPAATRAPSRFASS